MEPLREAELRAERWREPPQIEGVEAALEIIARLTEERNRLREELTRLRKELRLAPRRSELTRVVLERDSLARELAKLTTARHARPPAELGGLVERLERAVSRLERAPSRSVTRSRSWPAPSAVAPRARSVLANLVRDNLKLRADSWSEPKLAPPAPSSARFAPAPTPTPAPPRSRAAVSPLQGLFKQNLALHKAAAGVAHT